MKLRWQSLAAWVAVLGVVAGAYMLVSTGWLASFLAPKDSEYAGAPDQQHYWAELFGTDALITYRLEYDCGHDVLVAERDLSPEILAISAASMEQTVRAMQVETRLDDAILLHGKLPSICPDCRTHFWIGEQDGYIAVWQGKEKATAVFLQTYPEMLTARLPAAVQKQLSIGILVRSEEELAQVLEGLDR